MKDEASSLKRKLACAYQILYLEGIAEEDTLGHVSALVPDGSKIYVKPWGFGFEEVAPGNLLAMDREGNLVEEGQAGRLHSEMPLHIEIYRARPDVGCVVHIHPFFATLLTSVWRGALRIVNQNTQIFVDGLPLFDSSALIRSPEQGRAVAEALGTSRALLLKNHGIVAVGATVEEALVVTVQLERAARTHLALTPFGEVDEIDRDVASRWGKELMRGEHCANKFEYWCRKLKREGTGVYRG